MLRNVDNGLDKWKMVPTYMKVRADSAWVNHMGGTHFNESKPFISLTWPRLNNFYSKRVIQLAISLFPG